MALNDSMYTDYLKHMSGTLGTSLIGQALKQKSDDDHRYYKIKDDYESLKKENDWTYNLLPWED